MITIPLTVLSLIGVFLLSRKQRTGWLFAVVSEICWAIYGWFTHQWGLTLGGLVIGGIQIRAWLNWRRKD